MRRIALLCLALLPACDAEPLATTPLTDAPELSAQAINPPLVCAPAATPYTKQQLQQLCSNPETHDLPRPPVGGICEVEVRLTETEYVTGQGGTEGRGEISYEASGNLTIAQPQNATVATGSERDYTVGQEVGHNDDLGTYQVPVGGTRDVEICIGFREHDGGGANGQDDVASGCTTVRLSCSNQDSNGDGLPDGQKPDDADIGPLNLCGPNTCNGSVSAHFEILPVDADMDGVDNDDDFTPEMCDEELKATAGNGALIYWHYDDGGITNLVQSVGLDVSGVFNAYDYVVLVADNDSSNPMAAKGAMFDNADVTFPPTREGLLAGMRDLTMKGYRFDTFVFAHGYEKGSLDASFEVLAGEPMIDGDWLVNETDPCLIGTARGGVPIMAWWSTTCIAERQIDAWETIGAVAISGAKNVYFYPQTWSGFLNNWVSGDEYKVAVDDSLTWPIVGVAETFIRTEGKLPPYFCTKDNPLTPALFDGPGVVTAENDCAYDFFSDDIGTHTAYHLEDVYDPSLSGADNMSVASARTFLGDDTLTFGAVGVSWP